MAKTIRTQMKKVANAGATGLQMGGLVYPVVDAGLGALQYPDDAANVAIDHFLWETVGYAMTDKKFHPDKAVKNGIRAVGFFAAGKAAKWMIKRC